jgi:5-hydroxyisourate hydrolase
MSVAAVTTHVLDTARGCPAAGVPVTLSRLDADVATILGVGETDADGRCGDLAPRRLERGTYRLRFDTAAYFAAGGQVGFFPEVTVTFSLTDPGQHHHVPLLLSPFAYSTYRGS